MADFKFKPGFQAKGMSSGARMNAGIEGRTGEPGVGIRSITKSGTSGNVDTYTITFTDDTTTTFTVTNGNDGAAGEDGFSPEISVTEVSDGHRVTVTDADGTRYFDVRNGEDGTDGKDGEDGTDGVGIASISKTATAGKVDTYTITLTDGTTATFTVTNGNDGADGADGADGRGIASVVLNADYTLTITFTDGTSTTTASIRGEKGATGETGATGNGISSVELVSGTHAPGTSDTYRITFTDGTTFDFLVYNGANGEGAGDMLSSVYDADNAVATAGGIAPYVEENGGKIDTIEVNDVEQTIVDKTVNVKVPLYVITEDMFDLTTDDTKGVAPYSTSYGYTNIDIHANAGVKWEVGAMYIFVLDTKVAASEYRNVRLRIGGTGDYIPMMGPSNAIAAGSTVFVNTTTNVFICKDTFPEKYGTDIALHCFYDTNTTYTLNKLTSAGKFEAGTGSYAITRYALCMQKPDGTWEKIVDPTKTYTTGTTKTVNTHGFLLNHIRYYASTSNIASGNFVATNMFDIQSASVDMRYSTNCGTPASWTAGMYLYLVGTIGADGLFYLDTTQWWTTELPDTSDGKLYIQIGVVLTDGSYTASLLIDRPIFYHDGTSVREWTPATPKQDKLTAGENITIDANNVISAAGGGGGGISAKSEVTGITPDTITMPSSLKYCLAVMNSGGTKYLLAFGNGYAGYSTDGGANWNAISGVSGNFCSAAATDGKICVAAKSSSTVYVSTFPAYGYSAKTIGTGFTEPFVYWDGTRMIIADTQSGQVYTSTDNNTFTAGTIPTLGGAITSMAQSKTGRLIAAIANVGLITSTDHGQTWTQMTTTMGTGVRYVACNGKVLVVSFYSGIPMFYHSEDDGATWTGVAVGQVSGTPGLAVVEGNFYTDSGGFNGAISADGATWSNITSMGVAWDKWAYVDKTLYVCPSSAGTSIKKAAVSSSTYLVDEGGTPIELSYAGIIKGSYVGTGSSMYLPVPKTAKGMFIQKRGVTVPPEDTKMAVNMTGWSGYGDVYFMSMTSALASIHFTYQPYISGDVLNIGGDFSESGKTYDYVILT